MRIVFFIARIIYLIIYNCYLGDKTLVESEIVALDLMLSFISWNDFLNMMQVSYDFV